MMNCCRCCNGVRYSYAVHDSCRQGGKKSLTVHTVKCTVRTNASYHSNDQFQTLENTLNHQFHQIPFIFTSRICPSVATFVYYYKVIIMIVVIIVHSNFLKCILHIPIMDEWLSSTNSINNLTGTNSGFRV